MTIFRVLWLSLKDIFDDLFTLMVVNLLWALISAPLVVVAAFLINDGATVPGVIFGLLAVLPLGPSNVGLYTIAERISEGRVISWRLFFEGFRAHWRLSWQVYGLWTIGLLLIVTNLSFYGGTGSSIGAILRILFLYFLIVWFGLLIYIGPLIVLQTDKRLRVIARNGFLMVFGRPIFTLITLLLMVLISILSGFIPILLLLFTFSFLAIWSFRATVTLIADAEARRAAQQEQAAAPSNPANTEKGRGGQVRPRQ